jgi:aryl-alcohol dehydrogenase-like predicted oxidoreductase
MNLRQIGSTGIYVSSVAMGCWPIAGITSPGVTQQDALETVKAALDAGINFFDTAYAYGYDGESERFVGQALRTDRDRVVIATKGGLEWSKDRSQVRDASPRRLRAQCDESLRRLGIDRIDLYYLHAPDPKVSVAESAGALAELKQAGKVAAIGASNLNLRQLREFSEVCPLDAIQPYYNMLQRDIERDVLPWCIENNVSVMAYWPLLKGLLAGRISRDHVFDARDSRRKYPMFEGSEWEKNHDFVDVLRGIAAECGSSVAQLVIAWTIHRPGITAALCGAKRPEQIRENAGAIGRRLSEEHVARIDRAIEARGPIASRSPVA